MGDSRLVATRVVGELFFKFQNEKGCCARWRLTGSAVVNGDRRLCFCNYVGPCLRDRRCSGVLSTVLWRPAGLGRWRLASLATGGCRCRWWQLGLMAVGECLSLSSVKGESKFVRLLIRDWEKECYCVLLLFLKKKNI